MYGNKENASQNGVARGVARGREALREKTQQEPVEEEYFAEMRRRLHTIFKFYASFGDRINVNYLRSNKLHKMIQDAELKGLVDGKQLDILYAKVNRNKSNMDFEHFLEVLQRMSQALFA